MNKEKIRKYLQAFNFVSLFNELGWEPASLTEVIQVSGQPFELRAVAEKRGFVAFVCPQLPTYALRAKIETEVSKRFRENLLVFYDADQTEQRWFWTKREVGKPLARRERVYHLGQNGEAILQALDGIAFTLDEEEDITLTDVTSRIRSTFDLERVTKKFYERFKREHDSFMGFIEGIPDEDLHAWYASVMLNRLMFIYFIQNKNFLNKDARYLQNHLAKSQGNFYREFLLPLFFEGFSSQQKSPAMRALLGDVPYLNGGIFMPHSIEQQLGDSIQIADVAFEKIFTFFEGYQWHLDERALKRDNEINPDVLGYIFEKYINQKQMGAYYTKEDITEYISKNTILPFLFDQAQKGCAVAFEGDYSLWRMAQDKPDRYLYEAVRKGTEQDLPQEIANGLHDVRQRQHWNTPTPEAYGLPTEIWRETVARRQRYDEVKGKLERGEVRSINDFITYNLDIRQFAQDVIQNAESSDLLKAFWKAITSVTVLDPTCGSGAFLFAALNILEPLYEACLERMDAFLREPERGKRYAEFEEIKAQIAQHPNTKYFILKSIIVNNLYGVDIMEEAIEICKLRLFLKLVAQEDDPHKIEPLPDIDFNIRAGNTLVGFATYEEIAGNLFAQEVLPRLEVLTGTLDTFRKEQLSGNISADEMKTLKAQINRKKAEIVVVLDEALAPGHGFGVDQLDSFRESHKPFHWYAEFYGVLSKGGFDVIIGNPPYVEYSKVKKEYTIQGYETESAGNLYAFVMERAIRVSIYPLNLGVIIPLSFVSTDGFLSIRNCFQKENLWISNYGIRPAKLFEGVEHRLTILISRAISEQQIFSTKYQKWSQLDRAVLLNLTRYENISNFVNNRGFPKLDNTNLAQKVLGKTRSLKSLTKANGIYRIYYTRKFGHFVLFTDFIPLIQFDDGTTMQPTELKHENVASSDDLYVYLAHLNSNLSYWYLVTHTDCRNLNKRDVLDHPIPLVDTITRKELVELGNQLMQNFRKNASHVRMSYPNQPARIIEVIHPKKSKAIIDEIDRVLAQHYGFTEEELDFIINYDIKYRMGDELHEGEEE